MHILMPRNRSERGTRISANAANSSNVRYGSMPSKKGLRSRANSDSCLEGGRTSAMMGRQDRDQGQLLYEFSLDEMIPTDHLLRRINVFVLADLHHQLRAFYSDIGRPSLIPS
jgi:hypothetical protein